MTAIDNLRRWHTDPEVATAICVGPASWTRGRPEREMLDKARDAVAMLVPFIDLQQSAMHYRDSGEDGNNEEQVSIEAAQLALKYTEEALKMAHEHQEKRK